MANFTDDEFGVVTVRKSRMSSSMRVSVAPNGTLRVSLPQLTPLFIAKRFIASSRKDIRKLLETSALDSFSDGMQIGKSHSIHIRQKKTTAVTISGQIIDVALAENAQLHNKSVQALIRETVIKALRKESKAYLPKRLSYLADKHGFNYERVRFSHASSRWGSCSSSGTISLNIALMKLDFELIDYVLLHELSHTVEMNHSKKFWQTLENVDPSYTEHRSRLKRQSPVI
jgi:predicted metal-dependent hydrolase